ncbi:hypothetical protein C7S17_5875 [Burkholderia thailandensis]|nr:hypothetical protein [Burkholderia thailandensis]
MTFQFESSRFTGYSRVIDRKSPSLNDLPAMCAIGSRVRVR